MALLFLHVYESSPLRRVCLVLLSRLRVLLDYVGGKVKLLYVQDFWLQMWHSKIFYYCLCYDARVEGGAGRFHFSAKAVAPCDAESSAA